MGFVVEQWRCIWSNGITTNLYNLTGGIARRSDDVDPTLENTNEENNPVIAFIF